MAQNQVQFTWHATERVFGRFQNVVDYARVQTVLVNKPLCNGMQKVTITTLDKVVRIPDPEARNGQYVQGKTVKAVVDVTNNNEVSVVTIVLE